MSRATTGGLRSLLVGAALVVSNAAHAEDARCVDVLPRSDSLSPAAAFRRAECLAEAGYVVAAREAFVAITHRVDLDSALLGRALDQVERLSPSEPTLVVRVGGPDEEPDLVHLDGVELTAEGLNQPLRVARGPHVVEAWYFPVGARVSSAFTAGSGLGEIELPRLVTTPSSLPGTGEVLIGFGSSLSFLSGLGFFGMLGAYADAETEEEEARFAELLPPLGVTFGLTFGLVVTGIALVFAPSPPTYSTEPLVPPPGVKPPPPPKVELSVGSVSRLRVSF